MLKKCVALLLVLSAVLLVPTVVFAADDEITVIDIDPDTIVSPDEVIEYPGNSVSPDAVVIPPDLGGGSGSQYPAKEVLFTMTANRVTELLTTRGTGKSFRWADIKQGETISMYGTLYFSEGNDGLLPLKCGVCYYNSNTNEFITTRFTSSGYVEKFSGQKIDNYIVKSGLPDQMLGETNYGFIKNPYSIGYVYGSIRFAIIDIP